MGKSIGLVIVGAGVQGTILAGKLINSGFHDFVLLDTKTPMSGWFEATRRQGMRFLRTGWQHHISSNGLSLKDWAQSNGHNSEIETPTLLVFNDFSKFVIDDIHLVEKYWKPYEVKNIIVGGGFVVGTTATTYYTKKLVIATGLGDPFIPDYGKNKSRILHGCTIDVNNNEFSGKDICIMGGGQTAGTLALNLAKNGVDVTMVHRGKVYADQLEADTQWLPGTKDQQFFFDNSDIHVKLEILDNARKGGGITPVVYDQLTTKVKIKDEQKDLQWIMRPGGVEICGQVHDYLICCTGYKMDILGAGFFRNLTTLVQLISGYPILTDNLESTVVGLYFMGRLAEFKVGPFGRNIPGAKYCAEIISKHLCGC